MIVLNIVLMTAVVVGIVSLLAWAIVSDRRGQRAAGGEVPPEVAPLHRNLELPRELRTYRGARTRPARTRAGAARSTTA
jgi:hypothetical protein